MIMQNASRIARHSASMPKPYDIRQCDAAMWPRREADPKHDPARPGNAESEKL